MALAVVPVPADHLAAAAVKGTRVSSDFSFRRDLAAVVGVEETPLVALGVGREVAVRPVDHLDGRPHPS
jgi:hypothetical protein